MIDEQLPTWWTDVVERRVPDVAGRDITPCDPRLPHLLAFHGQSGAGKDAAADALVELGWTRVRFSDAIEQVAYKAGWDGTRSGAGRLVLQNLGQAVREWVHPDAWIMAVERAIAEAPGPVVVTGVRKSNEVAMIRRRGGLLVRVVRPGVGPINDHPIEAEINNLPYDRLLLNSGTLAELHDYTRALART